MMSILKKFFSDSKNFNELNLAFQKLKKESEVEKIFNSVEKYSSTSEIRYVGGCVRKIINNEKVDDIDLAVNLNPDQMLEVFKKNNIKFFDTGIEHGTITALVDKNKFEITSLRKDVLTYGRHAKVEFSTNWFEDASRRDFSINSIYSDINGNLFDPFCGKRDLENGKIKFIGEAEKRIKEDYLRILRYIRFFLNYSKVKHDPNITGVIKKNLDGIKKISSERLFDEFKKLVKSDGFLKLTNDKFCFEIVNLIFPQFKNINTFKNLNDYARKNINKFDFIFLISLMLVDGTDNVEYFIYKFNLSKNDQKRLIFLNRFFFNIDEKNFFSKNNLSKIFYLNGKDLLSDLINFKIFRSKKIDKKLLKLFDFFKKEEIPVFPIKAEVLMEKYDFLRGKKLGIKLKKIEDKWLENNFKISDKEIQKIVNN